MSYEEQLKKEFDRLVGQHINIIEKMCLRASYGQVVYYRDLMQECFVALLMHLPEKKAGMPLWEEKGWVYWKCRAAIKDYLSLFQRVAHEPITDILSDTLADAPAVTRLTVDDLAACLDGVERRFFMLMADGADDKELESRLGLTHRTVVQMRHNIKKKIEQYIQQQ